MLKRHAVPPALAFSLGVFATNNPRRSAWDTLILSLKRLIGEAISDDTMSVLQGTY
jgi:hypothetical protein